MMLAAAMLLPFASHAQNTLTVADGTTTNSNVPIYGLWADAYLRCQTIYPASEIVASAGNVLMTGGTITSLTYYQSSPAAEAWTGTWEIKMMEVSASTLSAFVDMTNATTVYTGTLNGSISPLVITLTTPYTYQGGNLLIEVSETTSGNYKSCSFYGVSSTGASWQGYNSTAWSSITGSAQNFMPKTTFTFTGGTQVTCPPVNDLTVSNITSTSATLSWSGNATGYTVYEYANVDSADYMYTDTFAVFNTLQPNTEYTFGVVADCGADGESVMRSVTFRTACASETMPWSENFDSWTAKSACWSFLSGAFNGGAGTPSVSSSAWALNTSYGSYITISGKALTMNIYSTNRYWAVTPNINITSDNAMFSVDVAVAAWSAEAPAYDADDTVAIAISTDGGSTFTALRVLDNTELNTLTGTYTTIYVPVSGYNNQTVRFAIFGGSSASGGDNRIAIDNVTVGEAISCMPVTGLTVSNITTDGATLSWTGSATNYTIVDLSDTTVVTTTADTFYVLTGLNAMTLYNYGVIANCGNDQSTMVTVSFATACSAVAIPYTEDFEMTSATLGCWSVSNTAANTGITTTTPYSGSSAFIFSYNTNPPQYLISPELSGTEDGVAVSFMYKVQSTSYPESFQLGYSTTTSDLTAFTWGTEQTNLTNVTYQQYSEILPAGTKFVSIKYTANDMYYLFIDSMVFAEPPSCMPVTDLTVDSVTATSVFLSWTGTANSYNIYDAMGSVVATGLTTTSYEVTGLTASTSYTFGVVADCGSSQSSAVIINATTDCAGGSCQITITGYDSYGDGWNGNAIFIMQNGSLVGSFTLDNGTSNTSTYSVCSGIPVLFGWFSGMYADEVSFEIYDGGGSVVYSCTDGSTITGDTLYVMNTPCPSCVMPVVSVTDADMNSITISWTGNAASYDVYNGTNFVANVNTNTYTFTGLTASTNYTFGVMAICSSTDSSAMATVSASTSCSIINVFPYIQDFSSTPVCWNTIDADGDGYNWSLISGAMHSASYENYVGALTPDNWLITPQFQLTTGVNYEVTWNANPQDTAWAAEHYGIFVSTTTADTSAFTMIQDWTLTSAGHVPVVDLSSYAGQTIYLAFRHWNCTDMFRVAIDNFQLRQAAGANQITVTLTQNNPMYGSVAGGGIYTIGDNVTVSATPAADYHFTKWVDTLGVTVSNTNPYTFVAATDVTLQAVFAAGSVTDLDSMQVTVAVNDPTMGTTIPAPGVHYFYEGEDASVIAVPNTGYHLEGWTVNVTHASAGILLDTTFNYAVEDVFDLFDGWEVEAGDGAYVWSVTANFALGNPPETHDSLTVITSVNNEAWGTVSPAVGTHYYVDGDTVVMGADPNPGYYVYAIYQNVTVPGIGTFSDTLYAEDLEVEPGEAFFDTLLVEEDYYGYVLDFNFVFAPLGQTETYTVTVNYDANMGQVLGIPTEEVYAGTQVSLTARANEGYEFVGWVVDNDTLTDNPYIFTVNADVTINAIFRANVGINTVNELNVNVYSVENNIVVRGAAGYDVYVFDINGRAMAKTLNAGETAEFRMPATGVYIVRIGDVMTKRVVVVR